MNNDEILELISRREQILEEGLEEIAHFLAAAPEGCVETIDREGHYYYRHVYNAPAVASSAGARVAGQDVKMRRYLSPEIPEQRAALEKLMKKSYYRRLEPFVEKELRALRQFKKNFKPEEKFKVWDSFGAGKSPYIEKLFIPCEEAEEQRRAQRQLQINKKFEAWLLMPEYQNNYCPENLVIETEDGHKVRSKSERMIADELFRNNIKYKYEVRFSTTYGTLYPDFMIFDEKNGGIYIWEHFGMMESSKYVNKEFLAKKETYAQLGYELGDHLLATFETMDRPLQITEVRRIVSKIK